MVEKFITIETGKINEYLFHIDVRAFRTPRMLSVFVAQFDDSSVLMDCGTSLETKRLVRILRKLKIDLASFKYLTTTHAHVDHNGGLWQLYEELKKHNPDVKILTNKTTKALLNDYEHHLNRGKRTYGNLIGDMKQIEDKAFKIINPINDFNLDISMLDPIETFMINESEIKLCIIKTQGHTPDHQSPIFIKNGAIDFIFLGEAVGTLYHATKLVTMPTSMPIYYNHEDYMKTLDKLTSIYPLKAGFGHFGIINGKKSVRKILLEHQSFMKKFRSLILSYYNEKPETKYILEKILPILTPRTDLSIEKNPVFRNVALGIVYGMMLSLGLRNTLSDEEKEYVAKYNQ